MARVPMVEPTAEPEELRAVFDQLRRTRGRVPGMYQVLAHQPGILAAHRAYFHAALDSGTLPRAFKEKIAYKVARLRNSPYCTASHKGYAIKHGVSSAELDAIERSDYRSLDSKEAVALELAEAVVQGNDSDMPCLLGSLHSHYATKEVVEIVALIGIMELACTLAAVFGLEPD
jgi:AhpD family alkylhydroperoxidase